MATVLNILLTPTYDTKLLGITDASTYDSPPVSPTIEISVPSYGTVSLPFTPNTLNLFNSSNLGITAVGDPLVPLPDGVYNILYYSYDESGTQRQFSSTQITFMDINSLQEKFDEAFMTLDMMECDGPIKMQQKVDLNSIYFLIQGSIAAANSCAAQTAQTLYDQANMMLDSFIKGTCYCSGNNYVNNFY